jgi:transposase-like protein
MITGAPKLTAVMRFTEPEARAYLESVRWPDGPVCPHCGVIDRAYKLTAKPGSVNPIRKGVWKCRDCRKQFTVTVGTIFHRSKVPLSEWLLAWYLLCSSKKGFSAFQLHRMIGRPYLTAWRMMQRIRRALVTVPRQLGEGGGIVEVDETYIGGRLRGRRGGYMGNKSAVVAVVERGGRVRAVTTSKGRKVAAKDIRIVITGINAEVRLMTDENKIYIKPARRFTSHESVKHREREFVRGDVHTNTAESYFSGLKCGIKGTYHHVAHHLLYLYLAEFDFRHNTRRLTDAERVAVGLSQAVAK